MSMDTAYLYIYLVVVQAMQLALRRSCSIHVDQCMWYVRFLPGLVQMGIVGLVTNLVLFTSPHLTCLASCSTMASTIFV